MANHMLRSFSLSFLSLFTATATAQLLPVPGQSKVARYSLPYGVEKAGGQLVLEGRTYLAAIGSAVAVRDTGLAKAEIRLFGKTFEAARIDAEVQVTQGNFVYSRGGWTGTPGAPVGAASASAKLAGFTVWEDDATMTRTWSKALGPYDLLPNPITASFTIGPVPVTVKANAGVGGGVELTATANLAAVSASLIGVGSAYGYGWASAGVGMPGASAGVQATLRFANTAAIYTLTAAPSGISGQLTFSIIPIKLIMAIYAELGPQRWKKDIYEWSMNSINTTVFAH